MNNKKWKVYDTGKIWFCKSHSARSAPVYMVGSGSSKSDHEQRYCERIGLFGDNLNGVYNDSACGGNGGEHSIEKIQKKKNNVKKWEKNCNLSSLLYNNENFNSIIGVNDARRYRTRYIYNQDILKNYARGIEYNKNKIGTGNIFKTRWFYNRTLKRNSDGIKLFKCSDKRCKVCICAELDEGVEECEDRHLKFCKVYNCVYKLRCNICNKSYIGETSTPFNSRFNNHKSDIRNFKVKREDQEIEIAHFAEHRIENIRVSILKIVPNEVERKICEKEMMIKYGTVYPYGLNVKFNGCNVVTNFKFKDMDDSIYEKMKHDNGRKLINSNGLSCIDNRYKLKTLNTCEDVERAIINCDSINNERIIKGIIFNIKKKLIPDILQILESHKGQVNVDLGLDLLRYRIKKHNLQRYCRLKQCKNNPDSKIYFVMDYIGNSYKGVNFNKLLNKYIELLPIPNLKIVKAFKYDKPLGRIIFNYNGFAKNLKNSTNESICNCNDAEFVGYINKDYGHVITGNLEIIKNRELREKMEYGTKYRIKRIVTKSAAVKRFENNIEIFIQKMMHRYNLPYSVFEEWKYYTLKELKNAYVRNYDGIPQEKYKDIVKSIKELQEKFIITYVDKANTSFAIICKKLYGEILTKSYGDKNNYESIKTNVSIIEKRVKAFYLKLKIKQKSKSFPYLILVPKFHKDPVKFRVVTCGYGSYIEPANKKLLEILSNMFKNALEKESTFIIKNSYELLSNLKNLKSITSLFAYDFEDLYNNIDLLDLKEKILDFFNSYCINVNEREKIMNLFQFVVQENYLYEGNYVFKQIRGLPMGGSCSSILADIYLHIYETKNCLNNETLSYRYIDDVLIVKLNNDNTKIDFDYYPDTLKLKLASTNKKNVNYLDVNLKIEGDNLITKIYDKRNEFDFKTIKLIHFESNIDITVKRNVFRSGLNRVARLSSRVEDVIGDVLNWCSQGIRQGYPGKFVKRMLHDFVNGSCVRNEIVTYFERSGGMDVILDEMIR